MELHLSNVRCCLEIQKSFQRLEDEDTYFSIELSNDTPSAKDGKNATAFAKFLKKNFEDTKRMLASKCVTSNTYFHEIVLLYPCMLGNMTLILVSTTWLRN